MRLRLLALPWNDYKLPQPAIGALTAYLRAHAPSWEVVPTYAYVDVAALDPALYAAVASSDLEGERVYATLLYPERADGLVDYWARLTDRTELGRYVLAAKARGVSVEELIATLRARLARHLDDLVAAHDWRETVVGLTTSFSQLFANVEFARRVKQRAPSATIVLGGSTVSPARIADSILATYPWIDYVVRGEGELPLAALLAHLEGGGGEALPRGVASRSVPADATTMWQVADLDELPTPDYDAYYARVGPTRGRVPFPIEGSRGCWWDRTAKRAKSTCQFCNLNVQWQGFRQRSGARIAADMRALATRHKGTHFNFLDNIVRTRGFDEFVDAIAALGMDARIFHEARANLRPPEILRLVDVGLRKVQFGLEALSGGMLARINKGTSVIQNLEVMKTCAELDLSSASNLIVDFPGSTEDEVEETLGVIERFAFAYEPPSIAAFELGIDSVVARFPADFGLANLRNHDRYRDVVPPDVLARLALFQLSYDATGPRANWWPVVERVDRWRREYAPRAHWYLDGQDFVHVFRTRPGQRMETFELEGEHAAAYRRCAQIATRAELGEALEAAHGAARLDAALADLVARDLLFKDGAKYLALATAADALVARARIQGQRPRRPARAPLPVVP